MLGEDPIIFIFYMFSLRSKERGRDGMESRKERREGMDKC